MPKPQCDHFQQFCNRHNVKVYVPIIRWLHCASFTTNSSKISPVNLYIHHLHYQCNAGLNLLAY